MTAPDLPELARLSPAGAHGPHEAVNWAILWKGPHSDREHADAVYAFLQRRGYFMAEAWARWDPGRGCWTIPLHARHDQADAVEAALLVQNEIKELIFIRLF